MTRLIHPAPLHSVPPFDPEDGATDWDIAKGAPRPKPKRKLPRPIRMRHCDNCGGDIAKGRACRWCGS